MLQRDPQIRISANECLQHDYLKNIPEFELLELEEDEILENDTSPITEQLEKINGEASKFNVSRLRNQTNSPVISP